MLKPAESAIGELINLSEVLSQLQINEELEEEEMALGKDTI